MLTPPKALLHIELLDLARRACNRWENYLLSLGVTEAEIRNRKLDPVASQHREKELQKAS